MKVSAAGTIAGIMCPKLLSAAENTEAISSSHRIQEVSLLTASPLKAMAAFYSGVLEMNVQLTGRKLIVDAGKSKIVFSPAKNGMRPYYHFAFNIPENKILSARNWLGERTKLSVTPSSQREIGMPNDVMPFKNWNAHSLFFWDPAGNILELICRHDLKNGTKGEFRGDEIHYVSEIGLVTDDVDRLATDVRSTFALPQYRGGGSTFRAIGDETGLLILFKRGGTPIGAKHGQSWQIHPTDVVIQPDMLLESSTDPHTIRTRS